MDKKHTLKRARPFHPIPSSPHVFDIDIDVKNPSVKIVESYMKEAPSGHANGESSSANRSQPVSLGRTRSQRAKAQDIDGSPSSKQQQIGVSQIDPKTPLSGHANGESSSAMSNGSGAASLRRARSQSVEECEIGGSQSSKQRELDVSQTGIRQKKHAKSPSKVAVLYVINSFLFSIKNPKLVHRGYFDLVEEGDYNKCPWGRVVY
ncbi:uncharacterized protein [Nicotiana tomentosiformis]|uniref:uncharacterized protein isoform X1 n=1 Tax=Nicotiana tomentosiformis TaxID=4098 RepID=UPI00388CCABB